MSKKAPNPPPVPAIDPEELARKEEEEEKRICAELELIWETESKEIASEAILKDVVEAACEEIVDRHYAAKSVPFILNWALGQITATSQIFLMRADTGETDTMSQSWKEPQELDPIPTDSWARGVVPIKKRRPAELEIQLQPNTPSRLRKRGPNLTSSPKKPGSPTQYSTISDALTDTKTNVISPLKSAPAAPPPQKKKPDPKKAAADKQPKNEGDEDEARITKLRQEMRGKEYTYDVNGDLLVLAKLDPTKLPNSRVDMKVAVKSFSTTDSPRRKDTSTKNSTTSQPAAATTTTNGSASTSTGGRNGKQQQVKKQEPSPAALGLFKEASELSVPMVEPVLPTTGVTVRESGLVKAGPQRPSDVHHMTKKDFMEYAGIQLITSSSSNLNASGLTNTNTQPVPTTTTKPPVAPAASSVPAAAPSQPVEDKSPTREVVISETLPVTSSSNGLPLRPVLPGRQQPQQQRPTPKKSDKDLGPPRPTRLSPEEYVPINPKSVPLPAKVTPAQRELQLGARARFPRDRPFVAPPSTTHLPPPIFPATSGHGFVVKSYLAQGNPFASAATTPRRPSEVASLDASAASFRTQATEPSVRTLNPKLAAEIILD